MTDPVAARPLTGDERALARLNICAGHLALPDYAMQRSARVNRQAAWLAIVIMLGSSGAGADGPVPAHAKAEYWQVLDDWVRKGGSAAEIDSRVVDSCTKLVLGTVDYSEWSALLTTRRDELKFRTDVCVKATIHRVNPQPEFFNAMFVARMCQNSAVDLYRELCARAKLNSLQL